MVKPGDDGDFKQEHFQHLARVDGVGQELDGIVIETTLESWCTTPPYIQGFQVEKGGEHTDSQNTKLV